MTALSPCIQICQLDPASGLCVGCARTRDEIALWSGLTNQERGLVMAQLPARRALIRVPQSRCSPPKKAEF